MNVCTLQRLTNSVMMCQSDEVCENLFANLEVRISWECRGRGKNGRQATLVVDGSLGLLRYRFCRWLFLLRHVSYQCISNELVDNPWFSLGSQAKDGVKLVPDDVRV